MTRAISRFHDRRLLSGNDADLVRRRSDDVAVSLCVSGRRSAAHREQSTGTHDRSEEDEDLQATERLADAAPGAEAKRIERLDQPAVDHQRRVALFTRVLVVVSGITGLVVVRVCDEWTRARVARRDTLRLTQKPLRAEDICVVVPDVRVTSDRPEVGDDDAAGWNGRLTTFTDRSRGCTWHIDVDVSVAWQSERHDGR